MDAQGPNLVESRQIKYFISYRSTDIALAKRVVKSLVRQRLVERVSEVFDYDEDIKYNSPNFRHEIDVALEKCEMLIALASGGYFLNSSYTTMEIDAARSANKVALLRVDGAKLIGSWNVHNHRELSSLCTDEELDRNLHAVITLKSPRLAPVFEPIELQAAMPSWMGGQKKHFVGREDKFELLDKAWREEHPRVVCVVADGGVGKSSLISEWFDRLRARGKGRYPDVKQGFSFSFYKQGAEGERAVTPDDFFREAWKLFSGRSDTAPPTEQSMRHLLELCAERRTLLVLDGLEPNQIPRGKPDEGKVLNKQLESFLKLLPEKMNGLCIITTRVFPSVYHDHQGPGGSVLHIDLPTLALKEAEDLVRHYHPQCPVAKAQDITKVCDGHAADCVRLWYHHDTDQEAANRSGTVFNKLRRLLGSLQTELSAEARETLNAICLFDNEVKAPELDLLLAGKPIEQLSSRTGSRAWFSRGVPDRATLRRAILELRNRALVSARSVALKEKDHFELTLLPAGVEGCEVDSYDTHPLIRSVVQQGFRQKHHALWKRAHERLFWRKQAFLPLWPTKRAQLLRVYSAVGNGVNCGRGLSAGWLYAARCLRGFRGYSTNHHGMILNDRDALSNYYEGNWGEPKKNIGLNAYAEVQSLVWSGVLLCGTNSYHLGKEKIELGYEMALSSRNTVTAARIMRTLSLISLMTGHINDALRYARQAEAALKLRRKGTYWCLEAVLRVNKRFQKMSVLLTFGRIHFYKGQFEEASDYFARAERLQAQSVKRYPTLKGLWCLWYCDFLLARGRVDEALQRARQALIDPDRPRGWGEGVFAAPAANLALATCLLYQAESDPAAADLRLIERTLQEAWDGIVDRGRTEWLKPGCLVARAAAHRLRGELVDARSSLKEAEELVKGQGLVIFTPDIACEAARILLAEGDAAPAVELLERALIDCRESQLAGKLDNIVNLLAVAHARAGRQPA